MSALDDLFNRVKMYIDAAISRQATNKYGILISVKTTDGPPMGRVQLQPSGGNTGWLPFAISGGGNGWGVVNIPKTGVQVAVIPVDGSSDSYIIVGTTWGLVNKIPVGFQPGDIGLVHLNGDYIRITQQNEIESRGQWVHQGDFTIQPNPNVEGNIGNLTVTQGNVSVLLGGFSIPQGNITVTVGDILINGIGHKFHKHPGVTTGSGSTETPQEGP